MTAVTIETDKPVGDGNLTDAEMGMITRLFLEMMGRMKLKKGKGPVNFDFVRRVLQAIIENRIVFPPQGEIEKDPPHMVFRRPPEADRRDSRTPYGKVFAHWANRLKFPERMPENVIAELWEAENIPVRSINSGSTPLLSIFQGEEMPSERDIQVVGSTIQWFGTNAGSAFLRRYLIAADMKRYLA